MNDTLKAAGRIGAELGAAKAENEKLRGLLTTLRISLNLDDTEYGLSKQEKSSLAADIDAELSRQAEPVCQTMQRPKAECGCPDCGSSLIDWPKAASAEPAPAQDEREAFKRALHSQKVFKLSSATIDAAEWAWFARPAQTEQQPVAWLHSRSGAVATEATKRAMEDGSVPSGYDIPLYAAPVAQTAPQLEQINIDPLLNAGAALSNIAFNLAQRPGVTLDQHVCDLLSSARKRWDAARAALSAQGAGDADS